MYRSSLLLLGAFALAVLACDKDKTESPPPPPSAPVTSKAAEPLASAEPAVSVAAPSGSAPAPSDSAAVDCGSKENPCPLQGWMRQNVNPPMNKSDGPGLAEALDKIAAMAPPGYPNWTSISKDGAAAARSGDMSATKASCRSCHDQYKKKYKSEMRGRKVPGA